MQYISFCSNKSQCQGSFGDITDSKRSPFTSVCDQVTLLNSLETQGEEEGWTCIDKIIMPSNKSEIFFISEAWCLPEVQGQENYNFSVRNIMLRFLKNYSNLVLLYIFKKTQDTQICRL